MSADLDDLFTALNQQADGIPLIGSDHARRIGRRRAERLALRIQEPRAVERRQHRRAALPAPVS